MSAKPNGPNSWGVPLDTIRNKHMLKYIEKQKNWEKTVPTLITDKHSNEMSIKTTVLHNMGKKHHSIETNASA